MKKKNAKSNSNRVKRKNAVKKSSRSNNRRKSKNTNSNKKRKISQSISKSRNKSKPVVKRYTTRKKTTKKSLRKIQKRYGNFLVTFTVTRSYTYNRPSELEIFTRSIPVLPPVTLTGFRKKYLDWIVEEEKKVFDKITEDQDGAVSWSGWIIEVKPGEEE